MRIVYSRRAAADLLEISAYLRPRSPQGAKRVRAAIIATLSNLAAYPRLGTPQSTAGVYKIVTRKFPYLIYYSIDEAAGHVNVITVRHAARKREFQDA